MKLIYSAPITAFDSNYETISMPIELLEKLDGLVAIDEGLQLAQYLVDYPKTKLLFHDISVTEGQMSFSTKENTLFIKAQYTISSLSLDIVQIDFLKNYTMDQFSDGGGNGWIQEFSDIQEEFALSLNIEFEKTTFVSLT